MDIAERAERWAREHETDWAGLDTNDLIAAYLAGAGQAQADYVKHYSSVR